MGAYLSRARLSLSLECATVRLVFSLSSSSFLPLLGLGPTARSLQLVLRGAKYAGPSIQGYLCPLGLRSTPGPHICAQLGTENGTSTVLPESTAGRVHVRHKPAPDHTSRSMQELQAGPSVLWAHHCQGTVSWTWDSASMGWLPTMQEKGTQKGCEWGLAHIRFCKHLNRVREMQKWLWVGSHTFQVPWMSGRSSSCYMCFVTFSGPPGSVQATSNCITPHCSVAGTMRTSTVLACLMLSEGVKRLSYGFGWDFNRHFLTPPRGPSVECRLLHCFWGSPLCPPEIWPNPCVRIVGRKVERR